MSDMLRSASNWLNQKRAESLSETVTLQHYSNGEKDGEPEVFPATRGRSLFRAEDRYGVTIRVHSTDFIVRASDISRMPQKGDEIIVDGRVFEVLAPNNEPVWRWSGNYQEAVRIHTKEMGEYVEENQQENGNG